MLTNYTDSSSPNYAELPADKIHPVPGDFNASNFEALKLERNANRQFAGKVEAALYQPELYINSIYPDVKKTKYSDFAPAQWKHCDLHQKCIASIKFTLMRNICILNWRIRFICVPRVRSTQLHVYWNPQILVKRSQAVSCLQWIIEKYVDLTPAKMAKFLDELDKRFQEDNNWRNEYQWSFEKWYRHISR